MLPNHPHSVTAVMVVDDEQALRTYAEALLQDLGYSALLAESGRAAVQLLLQDPDAVAAVLMDMTMPGMSPEETFRLLNEIRPGLPIIVVSGDLEAMVRERFGPDTIAGCIQKPYSDLELEIALKQALAQPVLTEQSSFKLVRLSEDDLETAKQQYLVICKLDMPKMLNRLAANDFESLRIMGHSLKGSGGCFGFSELTRLGKALESYAQLSDAASCGEQVEALNHYLEHLCPEDLLSSTGN